MNFVNLRASLSHQHAKMTMPFFGKHEHKAATQLLWQPHFCTQRRPIFTANYHGHKKLIFNAFFVIFSRDLKKMRGKGEMVEKVITDEDFLRNFAWLSANVIFIPF